MAKRTTLDDPQIRFNGGFWDGHYDARNGRRDRRGIPAGELYCLPTFDAGCKPYRAGYAAGFDAARDGFADDDEQGSGPFFAAWAGVRYVPFDWEKARRDLADAKARRAVAR